MPDRFGVMFRSDGRAPASSEIMLKSLPDGRKRKQTDSNSGVIVTLQSKGGITSVPGLCCVH